MMDRPRAALRMQETVKRYAARAGVAISMRVGLNSGELVVRSIGSDLNVSTHAAVGLHMHAGTFHVRLAEGLLLAGDVSRATEAAMRRPPRRPTVSLATWP
jgi:hypothetical protein